MLTRMLLVPLLLLLAACGGGGGSTSGGGGTTTTPTPPVQLTNFTAVTVDAGPASLANATPSTYAADEPFVTVTICVPSSTTCQTIDHVLVDTGSVGLRIIQPALGATFAASLPNQQDAVGNPVGECYGFVDGYTFGSVRTADFTIGGEKVAAMPLQIIADTGRYTNAPSECTAGGGDAIRTVVDLGANGILGIGSTPTDCGSYCTVSGGFGAAIYYDCPATGCNTIITRASMSRSAFEQLPNPVAAMPVDNNGTILTLPSVPQTGSQSAVGTLYFGIGTQTNNTLGNATVLTTTLSDSQGGGGLLTANYKGRALAESFVDSGSNSYFFIDSSIAECSDEAEAGYYCPTSPLALSATLTGLNAQTADASFTLLNADTLFNTGFAAIPGLGANPNSLSNLMPPPNIFDFGAPFFFGRSVFTAIEGTNAAGTPGPYVAF
jgi:hypothetical protein